MAWRRVFLRAIVRLFPPADIGVSGMRPGPGLLQHPRKPTSLIVEAIEEFREYWKRLKRELCRCNKKNH